MKTPTAPRCRRFSATRQLSALVGATLALASTMAPAATDTPPRPWETTLELVAAHDITLLQASGSTERKLGGWDAALSLALNAITIDYQPVPFDFKGHAVTRRELGAALQAAGERPLGDIWTMLASAGGYLGHTNYRSVWLDEYYYQQYADFPAPPGSDIYTKAHPRGISTMLGARWAYHPGSGFAQLTVSRLRDRVSPGYEVDFDGLHKTPEVLRTTALNLDLENILTPWARSLVRLRAALTTEREWRLGAEGRLNLALDDAWTARLHVGYTEEAPRFRATFGGLELERTLSRRLALFAGGKLYSDTGEIENALLFTSSAPPLHTWQFRGGVRWTRDGWSGRLTLGLIRTRYGATNSDTDFFQNLYRDRHWLIGQLALTRSF